MEEINMDFNIGGIKFTASTDYKIDLTPIENKDGILRIKIALTLPKKQTPEKVRIDWELPLDDIISQWSPEGDFTNALKNELMPEWSPVKISSRSASGVPMILHLNQRGINRISTSLRDVRTPCVISAGVFEETACIHFKLNLFTETISEISAYETELRIDTRAVPFYDAADAVQKYWAQDYDTAHIPNEARLPMYSTWYSMHQQLETSDLLAELKIAKDYGMDTVIADDGWQTDDNSRGYAYCGDWEPTPNKIPNMKALVDGVHTLGMKYMMWYSVPFVGIHSRAYERFKGMYLSDRKNGIFVLDPRYPEVRDYLCKTYEDAVKNWGLDGLKLDFIDSFSLTEQSSAPNERMDYESLEDAICALLAEIKERLVKLNPEILIEFRQSYVGPIMRSCGNMLRVWDCPADILKNRVSGLNLRFTSGNSAIHSDMLMWHTDASCQAAALQIINIMFLVPQISVRIEKLPQSHKDMLKFYMNLWRANRECLLDGKLTAENPEASYSLAASELNSELFVVTYSKNYLKTDKEYAKITLVNGAWSEVTVIDNKYGEYTAHVRIWDCTGKVKSEYDGTIATGLNAFEIPDSGVMEIIKK